jgi:hypothetical protein
MRKRCPNIKNFTLILGLVDWLTQATELNEEFINHKETSLHDF